MLTVSSRAELDKLTGKTPAAAKPEPATRPPETAAAPPPTLIGMSPELERTLALMANSVAAAIKISNAAHQGIAELSAPKNIAMEADIVRDQQGKMVKVIFTTKKF